MVTLSVPMACSSDRYTNSLPRLVPWGQKPRDSLKEFHIIHHRPRWHSLVTRLKFYCGYSYKNKGQCDIDNSSLKLSSQLILIVANLTFKTNHHDPPTSTIGISKPGELWALELGSDLRMLPPLRDDSWCGAWMSPWGWRSCLS